MTDLKDLLFTFLLAAAAGLAFCFVEIAFESTVMGGGGGSGFALHHPNTGALANPRSCLSNEEMRATRKRGDRKVRFGDDADELVLRERAESVEEVEGVEGLEEGG